MNRREILMQMASLSALALSAAPSWAADDDIVPPQPNGLTFFRKLQEAKVPSQMNVFEKGGHGFSLHWAQGKPAAAWPELFLSWAGLHGFKV